jgi:hypothetical protein
MDKEILRLLALESWNVSKKEPLISVLFSKVFSTNALHSLHRVACLVVGWVYIVADTIPEARNSTFPIDGVLVEGDQLLILQDSVQSRDTLVSGAQDDAPGRIEAERLRGKKR